MTCVLHPVLCFRYFVLFSRIVLCFTPRVAFFMSCVVFFMSCVVFCTRVVFCTYGPPHIHLKKYIKTEIFENIVDHCERKNA